MNKPASAPDVIPPREPAEPQVGEESEGSNATTHHPDPRADRRGVGERDRAPRGPYPTGND